MVMYIESSGGGVALPQWQELLACHMRTGRGGGCAGGSGDWGQALQQQLSDLVVYRSDLRGGEASKKCYASGTMYSVEQWQC